MKLAIPLKRIARRITLVRGRKVMLDIDLAKLYGVPTKSLNLAVKRNAMRFPSDFAFRLTREEINNLRFQIETSSWGGRRYAPRAFTEQGVAMLSSVLKSRRAALVNIAIMRAFVRLRAIVSTHAEFATKLEKLEEKFAAHDLQIQDIFRAIQYLMPLPAHPKKVIGFSPDTDGKTVAD